MRVVSLVLSLLLVAPFTEASVVQKVKGLCSAVVGKPTPKVLQVPMSETPFMKKESGLLTRAKTFRTRLEQWIKDGKHPKDCPMPEVWKDFAELRKEANKVHSLLLNEKYRSEVAEDPLNLRAYDAITRLGSEWLEKMNNETSETLTYGNQFKYSTWAQSLLAVRPDYGLHLKITPWSKYVKLDFQTRSNGELPPETLDTLTLEILESLSDDVVVKLFAPFNLVRTFLTELDPLIEKSEWRYHIARFPTNYFVSTWTFLKASVQRVIFETNYLGLTAEVDGEIMGSKKILMHDRLHWYELRKKRKKDENYFEIVEETQLLNSLLEFVNYALPTKRSVERENLFQTMVTILFFADHETSRILNKKNLLGTINASRSEVLQREPSYRWLGTYSKSHSKYFSKVLGKNPKETFLMALSHLENFLLTEVE